jgi:hypothetical protein
MNIKPTFLNQNIEEHPHIQDEGDFLAMFAIRHFNVVPVPVSRGRGMIQQISHGVSHGGRCGGRISERGPPFNLRLWGQTEGPEWRELAPASPECPWK